MMERDHPSNGNRGDPISFTAHAKKRNNGGLRNQNMEERGQKEGREDVTLVTRLVTIQESALIEGTLPGMMTTTTREGMARTTGSKEREGSL